MSSKQDGVLSAYGKKPAYNAAEVAAMLGVNVAKVNDFMRCGLLAYIDVGHRIVRHADLEEFLENYRGYNISNPRCIKPLGNVEAKELTT